MSTPAQRAGGLDCSQNVSQTPAATAAEQQERLSSRRKALRLLLTAPALSLSSIVSAGETERKSSKTPSVDLKGTVFETVGKSANIDPCLLYSIACVESAIAAGKKGYIKPYPWTLRYAGQPYYAKTKSDAERELRIILMREKRPNVDIGLAQVNAFWHAHRVKNPLDLLDPYTNLKIASEILNENFRRFPNDAFKAIGAYHSLDPRRSFRYARYVIRVFSALKGV